MRSGHLLKASLPNAILVCLHLNPKCFKERRLAHDLDQRTSPISHHRPLTHSSCSRHNGLLRCLPRGQTSPLPFHWVNSCTSFSFHPEYYVQVMTARNTPSKLYPHLLLSLMKLFHFTFTSLMNTSTQAYVSVYGHIYICIYIHNHICVYKKNACVYINMYMHTYINTHKQH